VARPRVRARGHRAPRGRTVPAAGVRGSTLGGATENTPCATTPGCPVRHRSTEECHALQTPPPLLAILAVLAAEAACHQGKAHQPHPAASRPETQSGGPHAIVGRAHLEAVACSSTSTRRRAARCSRVAPSPPAPGRQAGPLRQKLDADQLGQLTAGELPAAGVPSDFAPADERRLGRPTGVTTGGGTF
jgi:hypothetical protein